MTEPLPKKLAQEEALEPCDCRASDCPECYPHQDPPSSVDAEGYYMYVQEDGVAVAIQQQGAMEPCDCRAYDCGECYPDHIYDREDDEKVKE
jgi:hypothetical protein